jgi:hypothetical protein
VVPAQLQQRLLREHERWQLVDRQIKDRTKGRARRIRTSNDKSMDKARQLLRHENTKVRNTEEAGHRYWGIAAA